MHYHAFNALVNTYALFVKDLIRDRAHCDHDRVKTLLFKKRIAISGEISSVDVFALKTRRPLKLGVFRPHGPDTRRK